MLLRTLSVLALLVAAQAAQAQLQRVDFGSEVTLTSTSPVALGSLVVRGTGTSDVALSAHVYLEGAGFAYDQYAIGICRDTASGSPVGETAWTPGDKTPASGVFEADTLFVTGFDPGATLPARYVICARKGSDASPDVTATLRGFDAEAAPAGTTLTGSEAYGLVAVQSIDSTSWTGLATLTVAAPSASDVVLTAHVLAGGPGLGGGYMYEFGICKEMAGGALVGDTFWRPQSTADAGTASRDTIALTGFDANVSGTLHYVLCGRKVHAGAPALSVTLLGIHAVRAPTGTTAFGTQAVGTPLSATLDSTSPVAVASLNVDGSPPYAVRLTAHAYLEGQVYDANSRYEVAICRGSTIGPAVGRAFWRPVRMTSDASYIADTITLTGYDTLRTGPTTYVLCARKFDAGAPTVLIYPNGLVATVPEPGGAAPALVACALLAALRARRPRRPKSLRSTTLRE